VDRDVQDRQGGGLMEKRHDYIQGQQDYCSEGGPVAFKSTRRAPRVRCSTRG
jgi:hypothetical protein